MKHYFSTKNKALLFELVRTDFKLRYQGSALGYAWSLLRPLFIFLILYIVFVKFLRFGASIPNYPIYLLLGIVLWNFFSEMTSQSLGSIVARGDLIQKIKIPRWIIVLSSSIGALINVGLNMLVVVVFMVLSDISLNRNVIYFPLSLLELYVFAVGVSLFLSAAFVKYRDVSYIWEVILQAGFYATPILYSLALVPSEAFQKLIMLNPVAQVIQDARYQLVTTESITTWTLFNKGSYSLIPLIIVVLTFILGVLYFKKESRSFAENL